MSDFFEEVGDVDEKELVMDTNAQRKLQKAVDMSIKQLNEVTDLTEYLQTLIFNTYNTSCVSAMDLYKETEGLPELQLDIYHEQVYSLILNIEEDWVAIAVKRCVDKWVNNPDVDSYIKAFFDRMGIPEDKYEVNEESLLEVLPDVYRNEDSPREYKLYCAIQFICNDTSEAEEIDYSKAILEETNRMIEYTSSVESYMEDDVPQHAAEALATEDTYNKFQEDMGEDFESKPKFSVEGAAAGVGNFCGKVVSLKYKTAQTFEDAMRESLGDNYEDYAANREEIKRRKEEKKAERREEKELRKEERKQEREEERQIRREEREEERQREREEREIRRREEQQQPRYRDSRNYYNERDRYRRTPTQKTVGIGSEAKTTFILVAVHAVLALLFYLLLGATYGLFCVVGLVIAVFGYIRIKLREPNAILFILGGYIVSVISILLSM